MLQPLFLNVFLVVSGICCTFSRSNTRRGLRLLLVALALSAVSILASELSGQEFYIYFNVLHLLALGILLYAGLTRAERRQDRSQVRGDLLLLLAIAVVLGAAWLLPFFADHGRWWLLPLGLPPKTGCRDGRLPAYGALAGLFPGRNLIGGGFTEPLQRLSGARPGCWPSAVHSRCLVAIRWLFMSCTSRSCSPCCLAFGHGLI